MIPDPGVRVFPEPFPTLTFCLRRERDSNPRYRLRYTRFPGVPLQPLEHLSNNFKLNKNNYSMLLNNTQRHKNCKKMLQFKIFQNCSRFPTCYFLDR
jgi:hypothetical protein